MRRCHLTSVSAYAILILFTTTSSALGAGARLAKSGPIGITADGLTVWVVNRDHDSVSRIDVATLMATEFALTLTCSARKWVLTLRVATS